MNCPGCGQSNPETSFRCAACGEPLRYLLPGQSVASRYEIVRLLGRGGMGAVYEARDRVLEEKVALKVLEGTTDPRTTRRFLSEIKLARKVSHVNVCRIFEFGEDSGLPYISMELVDGEDFKKILRRRGKLPPEEARGLVRQAAEGLAAIHTLGIVHRDISPSNLMLDSKGVVRVMDFGIAKHLAAEGSAEPPTGYVMGKPEYMSPEQARGRGADFRSDLYSLGVVFFELVSGAVPFRGTSPVETLLMHGEKAVDIDPSVSLPPTLRSVLDRCLAKAPGDRYQTARELAEALEVAPAPRPSPRRAWIVATALAGLAGLLLVLRPTVVGVQPVPAPGPSLPPSPVPSPPPEMTRPPIVTAPTPPPARVVESARPRASPSPESAPKEEVQPAPLVSTPAPTPPAAQSPPPSPEASPKLAQGSLQVVVLPWADVSIDGIPVGQTPIARIPLPPGPHSIVLTHPKFQPYTRRLVIQEGERLRLEVNLEVDAVRRR